MPGPLTITITPEQLAAALPGHASGDALQNVLQKLERIEKLLNERDAVLRDRVEAAAILGVSVATLDGLLDLPRVRVGTRVLFRPEALRAWAEANEKRTA